MSPFPRLVAVASAVPGIIVMRGEPLVKNGPYRFMPHPNYAVVVGEMAVLPMIFDQPGFAALFAALNAAVIVIRVKAESAALSANAGR